MDLFYQASLTAEDQHWKISREESRHIEKVLRKTVGDTIAFTNGRGLVHQATIYQIASSGIEVASQKHQQHSLPSNRLHIGIAPTKNIDRLEWFLEKATELGIHEITPLLCDRSERKVVKPERLHKVLIRALKQSQRYFLPHLHPMQRFKDFVTQLEGPAFMAHCADGDKSGIWNLPPSKGSMCFLIGPEGDFSTAEIEWAEQHRLPMIHMGESRLRTETAALLAVSAFHRLEQQNHKQ